MSLDQVEGVTRQGIGQAKEAIGDVIGNPGLKAKGALDQAATRAQSARSDLEDLIDQQPVLVAAIALGVGIAIGLLVFGASRVGSRR